jgi:ADP-ribose pyrophosphatase YjhB (NUDIX family)
MEVPDPPPGPAGPADPPSVASLPVRLAARVVLLDPQDRILLMRYDDEPPDGRHWSTPGGGLNPGEDYPDGARRELAEETGWTDITLLGEVLRQTRVLSRGRHRVRQEERLYLARTSQPAREIRGVEAMHTSDGIAAWHWWTLAELDATDEAIFPENLADLARKVLRDGPDPSPARPPSRLSRAR